MIQVNTKYGSDHEPRIAKFRFKLKKVGKNHQTIQIQTKSNPLQFYNQFSSVAQLCLTLCDPMNGRKPGFRVFSNESPLRIRQPKCWSFSFNISPSIEHPGPMSFRMDWLDLLAVQGTQESSPTPQFNSLHSSVLSFLDGPALTSIHDYW